MWSGRADSASGEERRSRRAGRGGDADGEERRSRQGEEIVGRCAAATRSIHTKKEFFLRRAAAAASAGEMRPRQWRSTGRCGGADRGATLVGGSAGACGMAPAPEIQTTEKSARDAECGLGGHEKRRGSQRCHGGRGTLTT
jgi:hypothetical protein